MATEYTEVVVEGVTITIPRNHSIDDDDKDVVEVDVVDSDEIEIDQIGVLDGSKLVLTDDIIEAATVESESDDEVGNSNSSRVHSLITTSTASLHLGSAAGDAKNYVVVKADGGTAVAPTTVINAGVGVDPLRHVPASTDLLVHQGSGAQDGKERPFKCELCGKKFTKPEVMKRHKRSHNVNKDYSCTFCDMSFHRRDCLVDHMRNHTGEKPFQCTICNKKFTRGFVLLRHMRIHSDGEFECSVCHKTFDRKDTFNDHVRNHTGEKPYKCRFCPKSFSRSFVLTKHEKNHAFKKSKYEDDEYDEGGGVVTTTIVDDATAEAILVDDIEYEEHGLAAADAEILIPDDFAQGVIEETAIELEADEVELEATEDSDPGGQHEVLEEVYSIVPDQTTTDHTLQSEVLVTVEPNIVTEEEVVVHTDNITLTTSDGELIRVITKEEYEKLLQAAKRSTKIVKCGACKKTFASDSTYTAHFGRPWDRGGCLPTK